MSQPLINPEDCDCYKCTEPRYEYTENGHKYLLNNMEYHTFGQPCKECGTPRTEYRDLGTKGRYVCPECH